MKLVYVRLINLHKCIKKPLRNGKMATYVSGMPAGAFL